jgi:hypothetical protein
MVHSSVPAVAKAFWILYYFKTVQVSLSFAASCHDCREVWRQFDFGGQSVLYDGENCFVVDPFVVWSHWICHLARRWSRILDYCTFRNSVERYVVVSGGFIRQLIGQLVPIDSYVSLNPGEYDSPVAFLECYCFLPDFFYDFFVFLRDLREILLSMCTVAVLGMLSLMWDFAIVSNALTISSCSAWLLEHLLWSVYLNWYASLLWINITNPAPTPCSILLPSVKICVA